MFVDKYRSGTKIILPRIFEKYNQLWWSEDNQSQKISDDIRKLFPRGSEKARLSVLEKVHKQIVPHKVGVLFSGGPAPGGHDVIAGLFDGLLKLNDQSTVYGFLNGSEGLVNDVSKFITKEELAKYRFCGGFDLLGSSREKIEGDDKLSYALQTCTELDLDGLVIIGGDDSNTNAAHLAEYFASKSSKTIVVGIPKTIDGDLRNDAVEISFGFDTACKVYSQLISNLAKDALSAKKYTHFVKLMGRAASNVTLECALQTQPNIALIGEEIAQKKTRLSDIVENLCNLIQARSDEGKNYGLILIPEGLLEYISEFKDLFKALNAKKPLDGDNKTLFDSLPEAIQRQLQQDRDDHGNIALSHIETESLLISMIKKHLDPNTPFSPVKHFFGYEGRSATPSLFDSQYCYCLGMTAALLIEGNYGGYMASIAGLSSDILQWKPQAVPLAHMINMEMRNGKNKPVIKKALVDLKGEPFRAFAEKREEWRQNDLYKVTGPMQFFGPDDLVYSRPFHLTMT